MMSEDTCTLHAEKLTLYCLEHQELVCLVCRNAEIHAGHKILPLDEVAKGDHRLNFQRALQRAKIRQEDFDEFRYNCVELSEYVNIQREQVESKIKKDFEELRRFLQVEEEAKLSAVREEAQKKSQMMEEKIAALSRDMSMLSAVIRSTEEQLTSDHFSFMKNYKATMSRIQELPTVPELHPGALLDEVTHVGNLKFTVWERMKETVTYSPVILDPNTADEALSLSEDLTTVRYNQGQERPENPERFIYECGVLGSALASGIHVWDVEVGDNTYWELGVKWGDACWPGRMSSWIFGLYNDNYVKFGDPWNPPVALERIRLHVDTNKGSFSLSESLTNTELDEADISFEPHLSGNKIYPYFCTRDKNPLKIISLAPCVTTQV